MTVHFHTWTFRDPPEDYFKGGAYARQPDECSRLTLVFITLPGPRELVHMVPNIARGPHGTFITLCRRDASDQTYTSFYRQAVQSGIICPKCLEEFKATRAVLGMVWNTATGFPLKVGDTVVVTQPDSEKVTERGVIEEDRPSVLLGRSELNPDQVWVKLKSWHTPLKFDKRELAIIIQP